MPKTTPALGLQFRPSPQNSRALWIRFATEGREGVEAVGLQVTRFPAIAVNPDLPSDSNSYGTNTNHDNDHDDSHSDYLEGSPRPMCL